VSLAYFSNSDRETHRRLGVRLASEEGQFWDERYSREGLIWGWKPSPTALTVVPRLSARDRVLDVGFGYGRDIAYYLRSGLHASGIDLSTTGRKLALDLLAEQSLQPGELWTARFEDAPLPPAAFHAVCCHRMIHLLLDDAAVERFVASIVPLLRPGGLICIAARNLDDLQPAEMEPRGDNVFEYRSRPGHRIRYWDDAAFRRAFGRQFEVLELTAHSEAESQQRPVPCHLTVLLGRLQSPARQPEHRS